MRCLLLLTLAVGLVAGSAISKSPSRIVGGEVTTINNYPHMVVLLYSWDLVNYFHFCGGSILNNRAVLTAAHCLIGDVVQRIGFRVGSSFAHSGGTVHTVMDYRIHPEYVEINMAYYNDVAMLRSSATIVYIDNAVRPGLYASSTYQLPDNTAVWAAGWGRTGLNEPSSEQLREVEIFTVNQALCNERFAALGHRITDAMFCAGIINVGGKDQCYGDSGSPVYHTGIIVGVCSWGEGCADGRFPGVNARISSFISWIQEYA